jgi:two-component system phosphate regulon sensor histidine kinase PhoR
VKFRPANVLLRRAQLSMVLATLVPTILLIGVGIILVALGNQAPGIVGGILVLALCLTTLTGYILGSIFVSRGASMARVQNDFLSSVSHELRTPLTSTRLFIETLRDDRVTDPADRKKCLDLLAREVERLEQLVSRLLELSRMEAGQHPFRHDQVDVDALVRDALAAFDAATLTRPTPITVHLLPGMQMVGDHSTLVRALVNLLFNAWKYTPADDKRIVLTVRDAGRHLDFTVSDNGFGVPRREHRKIFKEFSRGQTAIERRTSGLGLGLAFVRMIARAHKGRIDVDSKQGQGAEFRLRLPRGNVDAAPLGAPSGVAL